MTFPETLTKKTTERPRVPKLLSSEMCLAPLDVLESRVDRNRPISLIGPRLPPNDVPTVSGLVHE